MCIYVFDCFYVYFSLIFKIRLRRRSFLLFSPPFSLSLNFVWICRFFNLCSIASHWIAFVSHHTSHRSCNNTIKMIVYLFSHGCCLFGEIASVNNKKAKKKKLAQVKEKKQHTRNYTLISRPVCVCVCLETNFDGCKECNCEACVWIGISNFIWMLEFSRK